MPNNSMFRNQLSYVGVSNQIIAIFNQQSNLILNYIFDLLCFTWKSYKRMNT